MPERFAYFAGLAVMGVTFLIVAPFATLLVTAVSALCIGVIVGVGAGIRAARARTWARPRTWLSLSAGCTSVGITGFLAAYLTGLVSQGGLDAEETCLHGHGARYDAAYVDAHAAEFRQWFPLHFRCNPEVDLVPSWVNPAIVVFALLTAIGVLCVARATMLSLRTRSGRKGLGPGHTGIRDQRSLVGSAHSVTRAAKALSAESSGKTRRPGPSSGEEIT